MSFDTLESMTAAELNEIKIAPRDAGLAEVIRGRWSPYSFDENRPLTDPQLRLLFEAARWTASCNNAQPWRFVTGVKGEESYDRIWSTLVDFNKIWAERAPLLVVGIAEEIDAAGKRNDWAAYDLGAAVNQVVLQATAMGMHARQMGGFDRQKAKEVLGLPEGYAAYSVTAIGYAGETGVLPERMQKKAVLPGTRKPVSETVFHAWGEPAPFARD